MRKLLWGACGRGRGSLGERWHTTKLSTLVLFLSSIHHECEAKVKFKYKKDIRKVYLMLKCAGNKNEAGCFKGKKLDIETNSSVCCSLVLT
jgi:hypothetical protein